MKIRLGFVSNSSSSSFVVVFPHKPTSVEEVMKFLFNDDEGVFSYYDTEMSRRAIAERVFNDINSTLDATDNEIIKDLSSRYYCSKYSGFDYSGEWFGLDLDLLDRIRELSVASEEASETFWKAEREMLNAAVPPIPYPVIDKAIGKKDPDAVKAYEKYTKACEKFRETEPYVRLRTAHMDSYHKFRDELDKLEMAAAEKDFKAFRERYPGYVVSLSYADEGGEGLLEHGGIFDNVPHIRISHH